MRYSFQRRRRKTALLIWTIASVLSCLMETTAGGGGGTILSHEEIETVMFGRRKIDTKTNDDDEDDLSLIQTKERRVEEDPISTIMFGKSARSRSLRARPESEREVFIEEGELVEKKGESSVASLMFQEGKGDGREDDVLEDARFQAEDVSVISREAGEQEIGDEARSKTKNDINSASSTTMKVPNDAFSQARFVESELGRATTRATVRQAKQFPFPSPQMIPHVSASMPYPSQLPLGSVGGIPQALDYSGTSGATAAPLPIYYHGATSVPGVTPPARNIVAGVGNQPYLVQTVLPGVTATGFPGTVAQTIQPGVPTMMMMPGTTGGTAAVLNNLHPGTTLTAGTHWPASPIGAVVGATTSPYVSSSPNIQLGSVPVVSRVGSTASTVRNPGLPVYKRPSTTRTTTTTTTVPTTPYSATSNVLGQAGNTMVMMPPMPPGSMGYSEMAAPPPPEVVVDTPDVLPSVPPPTLPHMLRRFSTTDDVGIGMRPIGPEVPSGGVMSVETMSYPGREPFQATPQAPLSKAQTMGMKF